MSGGVTGLEKRQKTKYNDMKGRNDKNMNPNINIYIYSYINKI